MVEARGQAEACAEPRPRAGFPVSMDDRQFGDWVRLLETRVGIFIAPGRKSFLASGIRARMREIGCRDYREYYNYLSGDRRQVQEWSLLVDRLTVHETCFFRHASSMRLIREELLPAAFARGQSFNAWSVGCATGEEAYSLAMLADDYCACRPEQYYFGVTGTDISHPSLRQAREGVYLDRRLRDIPQAFRDRYCRTLEGQHFRITEELRKRVCFSQLNLRDLGKAPFARLDLIYCQNLLIYYAREWRLKIVNQLVEFLRPGGVLVLGPGEILDWQHPNMEKVRYRDTLAYQCTREAHPVRDERI